MLKIDVIVDQKVGIDLEIEEKTNIGDTTENIEKEATLVLLDQDLHHLPAKDPSLLEEVTVRTPESVMQVDQDRSLENRRSKKKRLVRYLCRLIKI